MTRSALSTAGPSRQRTWPSTRSKCCCQTCCKRARLGQACTLWGACSLVAACEPMPAIFSYLCAQGFLSRLFFGKALQLKAVHIAIKPVGADDLQQPIRCHFCDLIESRSQALSHTFQTAQASYIGDHPGRIGALFASSF